MSKQAFTIIEVIIILAIIALFIPMLTLIADSNQRTARIHASNQNLSTFGRGFAIHATSDSGGQLTSGAFDWYRDGDVRNVGWIADGIESGIYTAGHMLDPGSPHQVSQTVLEYAGLHKPSELIDAPGYWTRQNTGSLSIAQKSIPEDLDKIQAMFQKGYNTNYATSWQISRGDPIHANWHSGYGLPMDGTGPITLDEASMARGGASTIPLMAEARAASPAKGQLHNAGLEDAPHSALWKSHGCADRGKAIELISGVSLNANSWATQSFTKGMMANNKVKGIHGDVLHDYDAFWPHHLGKRADVKVPLKEGGDMIIQNQLIEGFYHILTGDFSVRKAADTASGLDPDTGDGWLGAYPATREYTNPIKPTFQINDYVIKELHQ